MDGSVIKQRNSYVDALRGIAMLLVILGHTMTGATVNSESTVVFQIVWSLQMPLFILISGYVSRYSREIKTAGEYLVYLRKRTVSYLVPWLVWSIVIRGIIMGHKYFLDPGYILWNMDAGYWFLFTIWTIAVFFGAAQWAANRFCREGKPIIKIIVFGAVYVVFMALLLVVGYFCGLSFLGIKLTVYYMPFFFAGYLFGQIPDEIIASKNGRQISTGCAAAAFAFWIVIISFVNVYELSDSGIGVILRAATSLAGCGAVCGLLRYIYRLKVTQLVNVAALWCGKHTLEIYLLHSMFLCLVWLGPKPEAATFAGAETIILNFIVTTLFTCAVAYVLNMNRWVRLVVFAKTK